MALLENPYNRFEDAVAQVADGGTIYIKSDKGAFLNDVGGNLPFLIDRMSRLSQLMEQITQLFQYVQQELSWGQM